MGTSVFTNFYETLSSLHHAGETRSFRPCITVNLHAPVIGLIRTPPAGGVELHYSSATEAPHPTLPLAQDIAHMQRTLKQFAIAALFCAGTPLLSHANDISIYPALQCDQSRTGRQCPARDE
jgi:hypothetical protein